MNIKASIDSNNTVLWYNNFYDGGLNETYGTTGCYNSIGNFYDYRISNNSMALGECGLINITQPGPNITISGSGAAVTISWSNQSSYNSTLSYLIQTFFNSVWTNLATVQDDNYTWNPTQEGNYTINIVPQGSNGTYRNSTVLISFPPGPPSGNNGGEDETEPSLPTEPPVPPEPPLPPDIIPDPIEDIDVIVNPDSIIVDFITESGIEAKLKLILDDVGLLKRKPRLVISFKTPEIKGEISKFRIFDLSSLITLLALIMFILFVYSNFMYVKLGKNR